MRPTARPTARPATNRRARCLPPVWLSLSRGRFSLRNSSLCWNLWIQRGGEMISSRGCVDRPRACRHEFVRFSRRHRNPRPSTTSSHPWPRQSTRRCRPWMLRSEYGIGGRIFVGACSPPTRSFRRTLRQQISRDCGPRTIHGTSFTSPRGSGVWGCYTFSGLRIRCVLRSVSPCSRGRSRSRGRGSRGSIGCA